MDKFITLLKLLKPKYYNKTTNFLVISGTSIITKPLWLDILNRMFKMIDNNYEEITLPLFGQYGWLIGLFIIIIALIWNTCNRLIDLKYTKENVPAYKNVVVTDFETFADVCQVIYPILKDNEYIFHIVGPNSGANETENLRTDLTLWKKFRRESIAPNNEKIRAILESNSNLFDRETTELAKKMIMHIKAFETHLEDESYDYSEYRFPIEFKILVEKTCFNYNLESKQYKKIFNWLRKKLKVAKHMDWYLFGSSLFMAEKSKDFDVVIYLNYETKKAHFKKLEQLKMDFKIKFKKNLHLTIFQKNERDYFNDFIMKNNYKVNKNG